ncbi:phage portal protein [Rhizobium leguminosarum]|uniref:phage portal protein n=1 Tax=Rhizobium leguminosarum TaxID=384 RepID=UPI001C95F72D|nr:phage portal protein [Rhizobium leguminosarum]MBY5475721.1 phage portal protein [Rhizobium leguminosarum]
MNLNLVDKAVMYFNPEAGLRRSVARAAINISGSNQHRYAAGQYSRKRDDRNATTIGGDALTGQYMVRIRARSRAQYRDHELAKRMVDLWVHHLIGKGVTVTFLETDGVTARMAAKQNELFAEWANSPLCDSTGLASLAGLLALAVTMLVRDGEVLIRKIWVHRDHPDFKKMKVPLKLQVLEPDFLDEGKNGEGENGNPIVMGVEFDKRFPDVRVAYWIFDSHPNESSWKNWSGRSQSRRVPADEIVHMFVRDRNTSRGVSWFHPVLDSLQDLKEYLDALRMKAKIEACFSIVLTSQSSVQGAPGGDTQKQEYLEDYEEISPGIVRYARPGDTVQTVDPSNSSGHSMLVQTLVRLAAIGIGLTYDQAYSDLTGANYSSLRSGKMEFNRGVGQKQNVNIRPGVELVAGWFVEAANLAGQIKSGSYKAEATFDPPDLVDPLKDGAAIRANLEMGLATFTESLAADGKNFEQHMDAIAVESVSLKKRFGDEVQHPFIQTLMAKVMAAAKASQDGNPEDDDEATPPQRKKKAA